MAAHLLDILTLAEGKQAVGIGNADSSQDTKLEYYITAASGILDDYIGPVVQRNETDYLSGGTDHGQRTVQVVVNLRPVLSYSTVTEYNNNGAATVLTAEDYDTKPSEAYVAQLNRSHDNGF